MRESEGKEGTRPAARLLDERPRGGAAGNQLLAQVRNGGVDKARLHTHVCVQTLVAGEQLAATFLLSTSKKKLARQQKGELERQADWQILVYTRVQQVASQDHLHLSSPLLLGGGRSLSQ